MGEGFTYYTQSIGRVYTLLEWDGLLVAGGFFSHSGNTVVNNIAVWNGSIWSSLGSGLSNNVKALAVFNEVLYAGGEFGLSRWTGTSWESVMTQSWAYSVEALAVFNNLLYVGGKFTETPDGPADHIAVFDGNQWDVVGSGTDDDVYALSVYDDKLRVGGTFTNAGGIVANHVAYWDGFSWGTMGDGTIGTVYEFHDFNETLIAGCKNYEYLDDPSASLAKWSGTEWEIIEDGVEEGYVKIKYVPFDTWRKKVHIFERSIKKEHIRHVITTKSAPGIEERIIYIYTGEEGSLMKTMFDDEKIQRIKSLQDEIF